MTSNFKRNTQNLFFLVIFAAFSFLVTYYHTPYGAAMSMDSLSYLSAAQQITLGHGVSLPNYTLGEKDYSPMTLWPPLYPLLLSGLIPSSRIFGADAEIYIGWLNAFSLFITITIFWYMCKKFCRNEIAFVAGLLLAFLPTFQVIYMYAWSETLFIPTVMAAFYFQWKLFNSDTAEHAKWIFATTLSLIVSFYLRYAGVAFLGCFLICILFAKKFSIMLRLQWLAATIMMYCIAITPLLVRNYTLTSTLVGHREAPNAILLNDINLLWYFLCDEFFPFPNIWLIPIILAVLHVILSARSNNKPKEHAENLAIFKLAFFWGIFYLLFLIVNRQLSTMDLDPRMIGPALPFILISIVVSCNYLTKLTRPEFILLPLTALAIFLFIRSYEVYTDVSTSWKMTGTPGVIQNIEYKTALDKSTMPLKQLQRAISLPENSILITDIEPASFVHYFFPRARIKLLPRSLTTDFLKHINFRNVMGIVIITKPESIDLFRNEFGSTDTLFQVKDENMALLPQFVLMRMPLENK